MTEWTNAARNALDQYLLNSAAASTHAGADPDEVTDDLRRRVDEEIVSAGLQLVTERDIQSILARIGAPESVGGACSPPPHYAGDSRTVSKVQRHFGLLFWGVILPI